MYEGSFLKMTKDEAEKVEKTTELTKELGFDDETQKYDGETLNQDTEAANWQLPEPTPQDMAMIENIEQRAMKQIIESNLEQRVELEVLQKKYAKEIADLNSLPKIGKEIEVLKNQEVQLEKRREYLLGQLNTINTVLLLNPTEWQKILSEEDVLEEIKHNTHESKNLKIHKENDTLMKILSLGFSKPKAAQKYIDWKAQIILIEKRDKLEETWRENNSQINDLEKNIKTKRDEFKSKEAFIYTPEWDKFYKMQDLENSINHSIKRIHEVTSKQIMN